MPYSPPPAAALEAITAPTSNIIRRCDIYEADGTTPWAVDVPIISGSVSVSNSRDERRTLELVIDNSSGAYNHYQGGFYYDKVIKVYRGVQWADDFWDTQLGEFMIDTISSEHFPQTVEIAGRDYTRKLMDSEFAHATSFAVGRELTTVIGAIAANAGITKKNIAGGDLVLGTEFFFDAGSSRWEAIKTLAESFGLEVFFDAYGYLVVRPYDDPAVAPEAFTFSTGPNGNLVAFRKRAGSSRLKNHVVVTGDSEVNPNIFGEAIVGPTSPISPDKIGDRVYRLSSPLYTSAAQCQVVADRLLPVQALEEYEVEFDSIVFPHLDVGQVVRFDDPDPDPMDPLRYLLTDITVPLGLEAMKTTAKRIALIAPVTTPSPPGGGEGTRGAAMGIGVVNAFSISRVDSQLDFEFIRNQGATWVRFLAPWHEIEGTEGTRVWTTYDNLVVDAHNAGLKILAHAASIPSWANGGAQPDVPPTAGYYSAFANYCAGLADRGADAVECFFAPNTNMTASDYLDLLGDCRTAIKAVAANCTVVSGSLVAVQGASATPTEYLTSLEGAGDFYGTADAIGIYWAALGATSPNSNNGLAMISNPWAVVGDNTPPLWITSYGSSTEYEPPEELDTEESQAQRLRDYHTGLDALAAFTIKPEKKFWAAARDWVDVTGAGLLKAGRDEKLAAATYREIAASAEV